MQSCCVRAWRVRVRVRRLTADVGVFVGCIWSEYQDLLAAHRAAGGAQVVTGNGLAFMAGRVSYTFGFTGAASLRLPACTHSASRRLTHSNWR